MLSSCAQQEFNDLEDVHIGPGAAGGPVTLQPQAGQASGAGMPVFAMPAPPNPTNPFANMSATEATSLNATDQATYTPGMCKPNVKSPRKYDTGMNAGV